MAEKISPEDLKNKIQEISQKAQADIAANQGRLFLGKIGIVLAAIGLGYLLGRRGKTNS